MTEIQLQMSDKDLSSSLTETRENLTKICCLRLKMRTRQHYALYCDSRMSTLLAKRTA